LKSYRVVLVLTLVCAAVGFQRPMLSQQAPAAAAVSQQRALLNQYCVTCHNDRLKTANVSLAAADVDHVAVDPALWEKVVGKLRAQSMPPVKRPRPDQATYDGFRVWLENELDKAGAAHPNAGTTASYHRLNRTEYQNAVRDLLGVNIDATRFLPEDVKLFGFDNIGGSIDMSTGLLEAYIGAARSVSNAALGIYRGPQSDTYDLQWDVNQDDRMLGHAPGTRGGLQANHYFPLDGEYWVTVRLVRQGTAAIAGLNDEYQIELLVDGERADLLTIGKKPTGGRGAGRGGGGGGGGGDGDPDAGGAKADLQFRLPIRAGQHTLEATFLEKPKLVTDGLRVVPDRIAFEAGRTHDLPYVSSITVFGPHKVTGAENSPSRKRILVCTPGAGVQETACARQIVSTLARRAYRGHVTDSDIQTLMTFYASGRKDGSFDDGIQAALERVLVAPRFLYRIEAPPAAPATSGNYRVPDLELASRLSFFLWSSIPDDQLLDAAAKGRLRDAAGLEQQVRRMLADPRAQSLTYDFAHQWLQLDQMENLIPDPILFPEGDKTLRDSLLHETEMLFDSIRSENRSMLDLLTARYTFVNEPIAKVYGIPGIYGPRLRRVELPADSPRVGILGKGSFLMMTSHSNVTSPVNRGKWILENILGTPPPPPPPVVPDLKPTGANGKILSMRERMEQHRSNPACFSCHATIEPWGVALENFDPIGGWRTINENGEPVDASTELVNGTKFEGPGGLRNMVLANKDLFVQTAADRLLTYALGRGLEYYDMPTVRKIVKDSASSNYNFSTVVVNVVKSMPFQMRKAPAQTE
jgi:hypothetical protein